MKKRIRSMGVVVLASLAMLAMVSTTAFAQYPPGTDFGVSCTDPSGSSVSCGIFGVEPGTQLQATASYGSTVFFESDVLTADDAGEAAFDFTVPAEAEGQDITVSVLNMTTQESATETVAAEDDGDVADDSDSDDAGEPVTSDTPSEVVEDEGRLARTGQDTMLLAAAGLVLLTGGVLAIRRRKAGADAHIDA